MNVALFVPCYIDQFYPDVAVATLECLERLGVSVEYPAGQTCCGQPMSNTGCTEETAPVARRWIKMFADYDAVVCPSGSCTSMVRHHYEDYFDDDDPVFRKVKERTFEFCEFLVDQLGVRQVQTRFPHRVSVHASCHGLRELRLGPSSETMVQREDKLGTLLRSLEDIELVSPSRTDECCGFGGTFAVAERETSVAMGNDRVRDHLAAGSEAIVAGDMSCLMHMEGLIRRQKLPIRVMHIAQVLAGRAL